jgi:D-alanyl-D-alanine carboxypeptidase/D-alanyl-D-alanine-endopeptidase (penicillin-binding protein 4)
MKQRALLLFLVTSFWPMLADSTSGQTVTADLSNFTSAQSQGSSSLARSLFQLKRHRYSPLNQGILVESLEGNRVLAELNADVPFNPASVMKVATSFMALDRLGPDYRFQTVIYGQCPVDTVRKTLRGDLFLASDGNPVFRPADARNLCRLLARRGLRVVEGDLLVVGPFSLGTSLSPSRSAARMRLLLNQSGIRISGKTRLVAAGSVEVASNVRFLTHTSERLRSILWVQNAYSINEIADRLGDAMGGPAAIRQFLLEAARLEPEDVFVARPSGLEHNRITARAAVKMMRALYAWLARHEMQMQEVIPVAGRDKGTLYHRLRGAECQGAIVGKTGTNPSKDGGVSALAGVAFTRNYGPVFYAIFNTHGNVAAYRRWQDNLLRNLMVENGGVGQYLAPRLQKVDVYGPSFWTPSEYWASLTEGPLIYRHPRVWKAKFRVRKMTKNRRPISARIRA